MVGSCDNGYESSGSIQKAGWGDEQCQRKEMTDKMSNKQTFIQALEELSLHETYLSHFLCCSNNASISVCSLENYEFLTSI
jgi:hypothetical protein